MVHALSYRTLIFILWMTVPAVSFGNGDAKSKKRKDENVAVYLFDGDFLADQEDMPPLEILGRKGEFVKDVLPELGNDITTVYEFKRNSGLKFNNALAKNFLKRSYTIELYFKFYQLDSWKRVIDFKNGKTDSGCYTKDGKLNFYKLIESDIAPVRKGEYTHYVITRDDSTGIVTIYADGMGKIEFEDYADLALMDKDSCLNFFFDDNIMPMEASGGAVAMIKLYDRSLGQPEIQSHYEDLRQSVVKLSAYRAPRVNFHVRLFDSENKKPIKGKVRIYSSRGAEIVTSPDSIEAVAHTVRTHSKEFKIRVTAGGYYNHEQVVQLTERNFVVDQGFFLKPIILGEAVQLNSIRFPKGSFELQEESFQELDQLVALMEQYPKMEIEIRGHTDNTGSQDGNLKLSQDRVKEVMEYLIAKGVKRRRLTGIGFGGSMPLVDNRDRELRAKNRRVEFVVLEL